MQFWTSILLASFAQGLFLVILLIYGRRLKTRDNMHLTRLRKLIEIEKVFTAPN